MTLTKPDIGGEHAGTMSEFIPDQIRVTERFDKAPTKARAAEAG